MITAVLISLILPVNVRKVNAASSDMKIYAIDTGDRTYGDATYLMSGGRGLLMDTGDKDPNRTVIKWLKNNYQTSFDMYLSHYHDDHDYYMAEIINTFRVGTLYLPVNGYMKYGKSDYMDFHRNLMNQTINAAKARGTKIVWLQKGSTFTIGNTTAEVLWGCTYNNGVYNTNYINNNYSIISAGIDIKADIFKMNHHGGNTSNTQPFIEAVNPYYAWYNYDENARTDTWASGWCSDPVTRMSLIANTLGTRYNGTIVFSAVDGFVTASAQRHVKSLYEKLTYSDGSSSVKEVVYNSLLAPVLREDMFRSADSYARCTRDGELITYTWEDTSNGRMYYGSDGSAVKNEFVESGGNIYYLDVNGIMLTGWQMINRRWYYFDSAGVMKTGWLGLGENTYYLDERNGTMKTGWFKVDGNWHYAEGGGVIQKGWKYISGEWYFFDNDMNMRTGVLTLGSKTYLLEESGAMARNSWLRIDGKWYYANGQGLMTVGWLLLNNKWYYLDQDGVMVTGIQKLSSTKTYLFDASGAMLRNAWLRLDGKWYYANGQGLMTVGWLLLNNKWYYLDQDGVMVTGVQKLSDTKIYAFDPSGAMLRNSWARQEDKWYYVEGNGLAVSGWRKIGGNWYYFDSDCVWKEN